MNTTAPQPNLQQLEKFRQRPNLMEVPSLLHTPEPLHDLYLKLRKCNYVTAFAQIEVNNKLTLMVDMRDGEICNQVVKERIKNIFRKYNPVLSVKLDMVIVELNIQEP